MQYTLPSNTHEMRPSKHTLKFNEKEGLNGQIRIQESSECDNCYGFTMAYMREDVSNADYWYYQYSTDSTDPQVFTEVKVDQVALQLKGKQRNTFGNYMVANDDMDNIRLYAYSLDATGTTYNEYELPNEASVEYLGSHEIYWFPYKELLMSKVSDGSSFRFHRVSTEFRTTHP